MLSKYKRILNLVLVYYVIYMYIGMFLVLLSMFINAVKCNLTELTTKRACFSLEVSGVDTYAHVSEFHVLVDCSIA